MALTALQMVNELLSRFGLKEVSSFGTTGSDSAVALRKLNMAQQMISTAHPFAWAEKTTPGTITAVNGTSTYALASDVAHVIAAKHEYNGGAPVYVVDRRTLEEYRSKRSDSSQRNVPTHMTTKGVSQASASSVPLLQVELWPVPDANFNGQSISYFYTFILSDLANTTDISLIPGDYHWLVIDLAETLWRTGPIRVGGDQNQIDLFSIANGRFQQGLKKLISRDSAIGAQTMTWGLDEPGL
jgi:hypothetical protein